MLQHFEGDILKTSYSFLSNRIGLSIDSVKAATKRLEVDHQVIKRHIKKVKGEDGGFKSSELYIEINPERLAEITITDPYQSTDPGKLQGRLEKVLKAGKPHDTGDCAEPVKLRGRSNLSPTLENYAVNKDINNNKIINIPPIVPPRVDELLSRSDELLELIKEHDIQHCGLRLEAEAFLTHYTSKPNDITDWHAKFRGWFVNKAMKQVEEKQRASSATCQQENTVEDVDKANPQEKGAQNQKCEMSGGDETTSKKERAKPVPKPEIFKRFFAEYPATRRGGTDAWAWKKWKSLKIDEETGQKMLADVIARKQRDRLWLEGKIFGITRYLKEKIWLTPIDEGINQNANSTRNLSTADLYEQQVYAAAAAEPARPIPNQEGGPGFCKADGSIFDVQQTSDGGW
ncbi:hypothetical protein [Piscirickettsia litoralis]|uniref:Uncharacterized protein n=1 Tax=Piscirickettsia litoralis TaxID=1891921 RepID=A0ABX2ZYX3_9GAMM|nr:hypothetical protein [Piscirickettsia litoralis]ODN41212.1 hypothetical protein BGC07_17515 [Piscirickettsia litoralis]